MSEYRMVKMRYIDASALIKLVIDEDDCADIRKFFRNNVNFCTTSLCLSEALSRIKGQWKKGKPSQKKLTMKGLWNNIIGLFRKEKSTRVKLTMEEYLSSTRNLLSYTHAVVKTSGKIEIDESVLTDASTHLEVEKIAQTHKLDLSDALQLFTIKNGKYSHLGPESASILITADKGLAKAAEKMNIRVWNCSREPAPEWA